MKQNFNKSFTPKPIPKRQEKSAVDSYQEVKNNNVNSQPNVSLNQNNFTMKPNEVPSHEEIDNLKKKVLLSKGLREGIPVKVENATYSYSNEDINSSSFSKVGFDKMKNPSTFGTTIMEEQGSKNIILEEMRDQKYVDVEAEKKMEQQKKRVKQRKMWQKIIIIIALIFIIILGFIIYRLTGPTSNKHQLFCVINYPQTDYQASVVLQKNYYTQKSGLYKAEMQSKYVFSLKEEYEKNINNLKNMFPNIDGITNEFFEDSNNYTVTIKSTYDYDKIKGQNISLEDSRLNIDLSDELLEDIKNKEEQTGFSCNIK